jgi:hypothetical protein
MRVLLSAISCQPDVGSEPKVGWDAAMAISELHDCHVVTHVAGRKSIEQKQAEGIATRVKFHYFGEEFTWHPSRFIARLQSWLIFRKWQSRLLPFAAELHRQHDFHLTHHITYVTWRVASPLWQLPIPFVWGPIGGTAVIPRNFLGMLSRPAIAFEAARYVSGGLASRSKGFRSCVENAALVVAANEETETFSATFAPPSPWPGSGRFSSPRLRWLPCGSHYDPSRMTIGPSVFLLEAIWRAARASLWPSKPLPR